MKYNVQIKPLKGGEERTVGNAVVSEKTTPRRLSNENINHYNCAASLGIKGVAHDEAAPINRNRDINFGFNDFDNKGSLSELCKQNLRSIFQRRPHQENKNFITGVGPYVTRTLQSSDYFGENLFVWKILLAYSKGRRSRISSNFEIRAIKCNWSTRFVLVDI